MYILNLLQERLAIIHFPFNLYYKYHEHYSDDNDDDNDLKGEANDTNLVL